MTSREGAWSVSKLALTRVEIVTVRPRGEVRSGQHLERDCARKWQFKIANQLLDKISGRFRLLRTFPYSGRARPELQADLRSLSVGEYLIFYRVRREAIVLMRIVHGRRNLESIFE
jgi:toxin ParE1/3/4